MKVSYEAIGTWSTRVLQVPRIPANSEISIPEKPLSLIAFGEGPVMFYGSIESSDGSVWDIIDWEGQKCLQYVIGRTGSKLSFSGEATAFGYFFSEAKTDAWVRYTFYGTMAIVCLTLVVLVLTVLH